MNILKQPGYVKLGLLDFSTAIRLTKILLTFLSSIYADPLKLCFQYAVSYFKEKKQDAFIRDQIVLIDVKRDPFDEEWSI